MNLKLARTAPRRALDEPLPHLAEHPEVAELIEKISAYEKRLAEARARRDRAQRAAAPAQPVRTSLERADLLAAGGHIPGTEPNAEIRAANDEEKILRDAISELHVRKAEVESRLNYELSLQFQEQHIAALQRLDAHLGEIWNTVVELHGIDSKLRAAGYTPNCGVLAANVPRALYTLSDPNGVHGEAPRYRQWLAKNFGGKA